jgi:hypothetical protein
MYKIIGTDGRHYGPVSAGQIRKWIAEGRIERQTPVFVDGAKDWTFVGLLPEFANSYATTTPPAIPLPGRTRQTSSFATAGLVCGILSWVLFCCCGGFPFNVLGLVFSLIGLSQTGRYPGLYEGRGLAIAGVALSVASLILVIGLTLWSLAYNPPHSQWHFKTF